MSAAVATATYAVQATAGVTIDTTDVPAAAPRTRTLTMSGFDSSLALGPTTTPPVTVAAYLVAALTAGAAVLDLTALPGGVTGPVNLTGKRVVLLRIINTGINPVTVQADGTNGYPVLGSGGLAVIPVGGELTLYAAAGCPLVSGSAKRIALSGTDTLNVIVWAG